MLLLGQHLGSHSVQASYGLSRHLYRIPGPGWGVPDERPGPLWGQSVPVSLQVPQPHVQFPNLAEWEEAAWRRPHDQPTALEPTRSGLTAGASVEV